MNEVDLTVEFVNNVTRLLLAIANGEYKDGTHLGSPDGLAELHIYSPRQAKIRIGKETVTVNPQELQAFKEGRSDD
jgi:hypothetical protein